MDMTQACEANHARAEQWHAGCMPGLIGCLYLPLKVDRHPRLCWGCLLTVLLPS